MQTCSVRSEGACRITLRVCLRASCIWQPSGSVRQGNMRKSKSPRWEQGPADSSGCQGQRPVCVHVLSTRSAKYKVKRKTTAPRLAVGGQPGRARANLRQAVEDLTARQPLCEGLDGVLAVEEDDCIACLRRCAPTSKVLGSLMGCEAPELL